MENINLLQCNKCMMSQTIGNYYFKDSRPLMPCKSCRNTLQRLKRQTPSGRQNAQEIRARYIAKQRERTDITITEQTCVSCGELKTVDHFYRGWNYASTYETLCKACRKTRIAEYNKRPETRAGQKVRMDRYRKSEKGKLAEINYRLRTKYGITRSVYDEILERQQGKCAICGQTNPQNPLCVDHCHATGQVRGLLCVPCNSMLSRVEKDRSLFTRIVEYLAMFPNE